MTNNEPGPATRGPASLFVHIGNAMCDLAFMLGESHALPGHGTAILSREKLKELQTLRLKIGDKISVAGAVYAIGGIEMISVSEPIDRPLGLLLAENLPTETERNTPVWRVCT